MFFQILAMAVAAIDLWMEFKRHHFWDRYVIMMLLTGKCSQCERVIEEEKNVTLQTGNQNIYFKHYDMLFFAKQFFFVLLVH